LKWFYDLNIKPNVKKFQEENGGKSPWFGSWQWMFGYDTKTQKQKQLANRSISVFNSF
jgi:hypothetical protein